MFLLARGILEMWASKKESLPDTAHPTILKQMQCPTPPGGFNSCAGTEKRVAASCGQPTSCLLRAANVAPNHRRLYIPPVAVHLSRYIPNCRFRIQHPSPARATRGLGDGLYERTLMVVDRLPATPVGEFPLSTFPETKICQRFWPERITAFRP